MLSFKKNYSANCYLLLIDSFLYTSVRDTEGSWWSGGLKT